jgi:hypothetical protein
MRFKVVYIVIFILLNVLCFGQFQSGQGSVNAVDKSAISPTLETSPEINRVISIVNEVEERNNFLDRLLPDSNITLPFGIIKQIGAARYVIAIDSLSFEKQGAYFSAFASVDFPGTTSKMAFRGSHLKFNPKGVIGGDQSKLYLASNHLIKINNTVSLKLLGNGQNWIEWDCNGFKAINLVGNFIFNKGKIVPDPLQTSENEVTATFQIYTTDIHNFITSVNITPFKIQGLDDWAFKVKNAIVDMSEIKNANEMIFPNGYNNPNLISPEMWQGFYLQDLKVTLPTEVSKNGKKTEVEVKNLLIDNMGLTGLFQANGLFKLNEGSMSGWNFSIDELGIGFVCNKISKGHLGGRVNVPIMDSTTSLKYNADVNYNPITKDLDYNFLIKSESNIRFEVFSAYALLSSNSSINVVKSQGYFKPTANLSGLISFDDPKFNSNGGKLAFQNLTITTDRPYITNGVFALHNINGGQAKCGYYPVSVDDIIFGVDKGAPVLGLNVKFNLTELTSNLFTIGTSILLKGKIEDRQEPYGDNWVYFNKTRWKFDKVEINGANIEVETSPFTLKGNILYKDNDPIYGSGFFGLLDLSIKKVIEDPIGVNVGFGSKENYRYFFIDTKVPTRYIIPSAAFALSRLSGGIYYHMEPSKTADADYIAMSQNLNNTVGHALTYVPNPTVALGLRMGAEMDFVMNESIFNGDFVLDINFWKSGALGSINLRGNAYSLATIKNKVNAPIKGKMEMTFDPHSKTFDALTKVDISFYQIIRGSGYLKLHFDPQIWYACIGRPSAPNTIGVLSIANASSYFMVGNSIEPAWPLPKPVSNRDVSQIQNGRGFCAGLKIHSDFNHSIGLPAFNVSGSYYFDLGCDLMMMNYGEKATCGNSEEKIGVNGRLLEGDAYLDLHAKVSIDGRFKFLPACPYKSTTHTFCGEGHCCCLSINVPCIIDKSFNYEVFNADVSAIASAQLPKPLYLEGALTCHYKIFEYIESDFSFNYKYGEYCNPQRN